ncbi:hypothetical protein ACFQ5N_07515 [Lutibacter holmesii]|uniref:Uncharacterized protein n=1 Tax=Lutibacter holmesii TaxID=1137985 RepID=A0ABW3WMU2_9FLAO
MKTKTKFNFHKHTYCEFEMVDIHFFKEKSPHYKSKSGSLYLYSNNGVYRYSNHWGRVANCRWNIKGVENYKNQNYYIGYAIWSDFHSLNSTEKVFCLEVNSNEVLKIVHVNEAKKKSPFLMTLDFAHKRLKQINTLYKDYKWATYYHHDVNLVRDVLIQKLVNSDTPFPELKRNLRFEFN